MAPDPLVDPSKMEPHHRAVVDALWRMETSKRYEWRWRLPDVRAAARRKRNGVYGGIYTVLLHFDEPGTSGKEWELQVWYHPRHSFSKRDIPIARVITYFLGELLQPQAAPLLLDGEIAFKASPEQARDIWWCVRGQVAAMFLGGARMNLADPQPGVHWSDER